jgi:hypothetical protein
LSEIILATVLQKLIQKGQRALGNDIERDKNYKKITINIKPFCGIKYDKCGWIGAIL